MASVCEVWDSAGVKEGRFAVGVVAAVSGGSGVGGKCYPGVDWVCEWSLW